MAFLLNLQGLQRKLLHAALYELLAVVIVTVAMQLTADQSWAQGLGLAVSTSAIALVWNMAFNALFEAWERRQQSHERTLARRVVHALCFEGGLVLLTVPAIVWWMHMAWWQALVTDVGLVLLFLVYSFCFNWVFDHLFGLPRRQAHQVLLS